MASRLSPLILARLIHVFDIELVDQKIGLPVTIHLDAVAIVPFDAALNLFAVFEDDHHRGVRLHLLLVVEALGMSLLWRRAFSLQDGAPVGALTIGSLATITAVEVSSVQRRTNQLAADKFFLL